MSVLGVAFITQFASAAISEPQREKNAYDQAKDICDQIPIVQGQINDIINLREEIAKSGQVEGDTQSKIIELNSTIQARMNSVVDEQKKFKTRILISLVTNILLVAIIGIFLFS